MTKALLFTLTVFVLGTGCVEDNVGALDPCQADSDCDGVCLENFCRPPGTTQGQGGAAGESGNTCLLYTSPSPRD